MNLKSCLFIINLIYTSFVFCVITNNRNTSEESPVYSRLDAELYCTKKGIISVTPTISFFSLSDAVPNPVTTLVFAANKGLKLRNEMLVYLYL